MLCRTEARRRLVREHEGLNGLDYLEVSDDQRQLTVYFLDKAPAELVPANVRITGGRRIRDIEVTGIDVCRSEDPERDDCLTVSVDRPGDFSCYRLCIVELDDRGRGTDRPRHDFDPRYACLDFTFKAGCPTDLDCLPVPCPPATLPEPAVDYLAKDYASFRQLLLDRLALLVPDWRERHVPDLGITLVELLAYVGDHLSYQQDAIATEAYLDTARLRVSVRRHARLVDYAVHEGCNARAWVSLEADDGDVALEGGVLGYVTSLEGLLPSPAPTIVAAAALERVPASGYEWFEPMPPAPQLVRAAHSTIQLYTWGDTECCLPTGSTRAVLLGALAIGEPKLSEPHPTSEPPHGPVLHLAAGDALLLEEVLGPGTGLPADADPRHRHVVRLTEVEASVDPLDGTAVVEVAWAAADALPFPLCISTIGPAPGCEPLDPVSVARANLVLVDHGRTVRSDLGEVSTIDVQPPCDAGCPDPPVRVPGPFRPALEGSPLTHATPLDRNAPAARAMVQDPRAAMASVAITSTPAHPGAGRTWDPHRDLLSSAPDDRHVVVEVDDDGHGHIRFGDGAAGRAPEAGEAFSARYRLGCGLPGNVGAGMITHLVMAEPPGGDLPKLRVRNPLAACGGRPPEPLADVKAYAPGAFRRDRARAVTAADYAELARRDHPDEVQRAAAELQWTGSWYEVQVAVDALGRSNPESAVVAAVEARLERYRRISHDLRVEPAKQVPLDLALTVCVAEHHRGAEVVAAVTERLGSGSLGFFHPDRLSFGEGISVSRIVGEVATVAGVDNVVVTRLRRLGDPDDGALELGVLRIGIGEIARLDNDPSFPERGILHVTPVGGR